MINFISDYQEGCIPEILRKMAEFNLEANPGYGKDYHCENAKNLIKSALNNYECDIHFVSGGTLANILVISSALKNYQGVICAKTAHIATHETGAIEHSGHKVIEIECENGKISAENIEKCILSHHNNAEKEHTVMPGMVYISNSTETGSIYSLDEIKSISAVCKKYGIIFYLDGARLLYALSSAHSDVSLCDLAKYCDVFYIGGTKAGALLGEAVVINNPAIKDCFRYNLKQNGALMSKGFLMGLQFEGLFENDNYKKYCKRAVDFADRIRQCAVDKEIEVTNISYDTQVFLSFSKAQYEILKKHFDFGSVTLNNEKVDVRICTSWATESQNVNKLIYAINLL